VCEGVCVCACVASIRASCCSCRGTRVCVRVCEGVYVCEGVCACVLAWLPPERGVAAAVVRMCVCVCV